MPARRQGGLVTRQGGVPDGDFEPVADATIKCGVSRERLVRAIQMGKIRGTKKAGYWLVDKRDAARIRRLGSAESTD
jgi:hypothetical protein